MDAFWKRLRCAASYDRLVSLRRAYHDLHTPHGGLIVNDSKILDHISALVHEEDQLRAAGAAAGNAERLRHVEEQLDQCWDLLRQRRAKREFGQDPNAAQVRDAGTVENYEG
jgi:hypothetical protein